MLINYIMRWCLTFAKQKADRAQDCYCNIKTICVHASLITKHAWTFSKRNWHFYTVFRFFSFCYTVKTLKSSFKVQVVPGSLRHRCANGGSVFCPIGGSCASVADVKRRTGRRSSDVWALVIPNGSEKNPAVLIGPIGAGFGWRAWDLSRSCTGRFAGTRPRETAGFAALPCTTRGLIPAESI